MSERPTNKNILGLFLNQIKDLGIKVLQDQMKKIVFLLALVVFSHCQTCGDGTTNTPDETCDIGTDTSAACLACVLQPGWTCTGSTASTCSSSCGDNIRTSDEECDTDDGGCDLTDDKCVQKPGYSCDTPLGEKTTCAQVCGNAIKTHTEMCDNGNKAGCESGCTVTNGYTCLGENGASSICTIIPDCGNGVTEPSYVKSDGMTYTEACDSQGGQGCTSTCTVVDGYTCNTDLIPSVCSKCGDNITQATEQCDGNVEGCMDCIVQDGWKCTKDSPSVCTRDPVCNDGKWEEGEECDNAGNATDGCDDTCKIDKIDYTCTGTINTGTPSVCTKKFICGNEKFEHYGGEQCDNGNKTGCINCMVDPGYYCQSSLNEKSECQISQLCGNGNLNVGEQCDFGGKILDGHEGCSPTCQIVDGWRCLEINFCVKSSDAACGNSVTEPHNSEFCDDGNMMSGDGCSATCTKEPGYTCLLSSDYKSTCRRNCGDSFRQQALEEDCDDGNVVDGDGCSSMCKIEEKYDCTAIEGAKSRCKKVDDPFCGNGYLDKGEQCDNGWNINWGGCSKCKVMDGYSCLPFNDAHGNPISICYAI